jgi:hypothetical protein
MPDDLDRMTLDVRPYMAYSLSPSRIILHRVSAISFVHVAPIGGCGPVHKGGRNQVAECPGQYKPNTERQGRMKREMCKSWVTFAVSLVVCSQSSSPHSSASELMVLSPVGATPQHL